MSPVTAADVVIGLLVAAGATGLLIPIFAAISRRLR